MAKTTSTVGIKVVTDSSGAVKGLKLVGDQLSSLAGKSGAGKALDGIADTGKISKIKSLTSSLVSANLITGTLSKAFGMVSSSLGGAIDRFDKLNTFPKVLTAMGASAEDAEKATAILSEGIDGLPTSLQEVSDTAGQMFTVFKDADKSAKSTIALNNAFLASGSDAGKAARGTEQYMKILRTGKVEADSWTTLQETMGFALDKVAQKFGKTGRSAQEDLKKALQDGTITIDEFNDALIEVQDGLDGTAKVAETTTAGIGTSFTNMRNAVTSGLATTITSVDKLVKAITGKTIAGNLDGVKELIKGTFKNINGFIEGSIEPVQNFVKSFDTASKSPALLWIQDMANKIKLQWTLTFRIIGSQLGELLGEFVDFAKGLQPTATAVVAVISSWAYVISSFASTGLPIAIEIAKSIFQGFADFITPIINGISQLFWDTSAQTTDGILNNALPALQQFGDWVENNKPKIEELGKILGGVFVAFMAFKGIMTIISVFQTVMTVITGIGTAITGIGTAIAIVMNPITLIALAIGALVGVIIYLWNTSEGFKNGLITIWNTIVSVVTPIIQFFANGIQAIWNILTAWWEENGAGLLKTATDTWNAISSTIGTLINAIAEVIKIVIDKITAWWDKWGIVITTLVEVTWSAIKRYFEMTLKTILDIFKLVWDTIGNVIQTVMGVIQGIIETVMGIITGDWDRAWNGIGQIISSVGEGIKNSFSNIMEFGKNVVSNAIASITGFFGDLWDIDLWGAGKAIIDGFLDGLVSAFDGVKDFVGGIASWIAENKGPISYDKILLIPAGNAIMKGLNAGLTNGFKAVKSNVSGMADVIADTMNTSLNASYSLDTNLSNSTNTLAGNLESDLQRQRGLAPIVVNVENVDSDARINQLTRRISETMEIQYQGNNQFE